MLQIIGWLGCLYLFIKALEICSGSEHRTGQGHLKTSAAIACGLGWAGALGFAVWIFAQGAALNGQLSPLNLSSMGGPGVPTEVGETLPEELMSQELSPSQVDCITKAKSNDEILSCK